MIKSKKGRLRFRGTEVEIFADFCCIILGLIDLGISEENITNALDLAKAVRKESEEK